MLVHNVHGCNRAYLQCVCLPGCVVHMCVCPVQCIDSFVLLYFEVQLCVGGSGYVGGCSVFCRRFHYDGGSHCSRCDNFEFHAMFVFLLIVIIY